MPEVRPIAGVSRRGCAVITSTEDVHHRGILNHSASSASTGAQPDNANLYLWSTHQKPAGTRQAGVAKMLTLVADRDQAYAEVVGELLRRQDHRVVIAQTNNSVQQFLSRSAADLIVLSASINEDREDATLESIVSDLRQRQDAPVIVLVDQALPSHVAGLFEAGADDCIRKPFHPSEFAARIRAVARRCVRETTDRPLPTPLVSDESEPSLRLDHQTRRAFLRGADLRLSELEFDILSSLDAADGDVLTHAALNERVWGYPNLKDGTLLKGHVSSIRRKVGETGFRKPLIRTIYGVGYALSPNQ